MQELFTRQLAAFYDPRRGELGIAGGTLGGARRVMATVTGRDVVGEITIAHELTHALQDQHWGLPVDPVPILDAHTDRVLARRALLEGDATWAASPPWRAAASTTPCGPASSTSSTPCPLSWRGRPPTCHRCCATRWRSSIATGRSSSTSSCCAAAGRRVDKAHADPPVSSEQVLHPERYLSVDRDRPTPVVIGGNDGALTGRLHAGGRRYPGRDHHPQPAGAGAAAPACRGGGERLGRRPVAGVHARRRLGGRVDDGVGLVRRRRRVRRRHEDRGAGRVRGAARRARPCTARPVAAGAAARRVGGGLPAARSRRR